MCPEGLLLNHKTVLPPELWPVVERQQQQHEDAAQNQPATAEAKVEEKKTWCICSPTTHPGSFRCRYHRKYYQWGSKRTTEDTELLD
ncbi:hypothetical protein AMTRI_Chr13g121730 [Amborella trichopoda]